MSINNQQEYTNKGFVRLPNIIANGLIIASWKCTKRELQVIGLIVRLTYGCHEEWARFRQADIKVVGIADSHAKEVISSLISKRLVLRNGRVDEFKVNEIYLSSILDNQQKETSLLKSLIGRQLKERFSSKSKSNHTNGVKPELLKQKELASQNRNGLSRQNGALSKLNDALHIVSKDIDTDIFTNNKDIIVTEPLREKSKIDPQTFIPNSDTEEEALKTWLRIEPDNPDSFNFYIWAAHKGLTTVEFNNFADQVLQKCEQNQIENPGAYFNGMVMKYLRDQGLTSPKDSVKYEISKQKRNFLNNHSF